MQRVRGIEDARRLRDELRALPKPATPVRTHVAAPTGVGAAPIVAEAGDRIAMDYDELARTEGDLDKARDVLSELLDRAAELEGPLGDGKGPVSRQMRQAFGLRADDVGGGVRAALKSYLAELESLRAAMHEVGRTHRQQDAEAARAMGAK
ncbi:hypothetical protein [Actinosynnema sp. NPDC020468]|uniref:hypothetical protein n=1 Tax=Actinosynnema sp. NPDC020468 TaxID=3154488 RepID=UPI0033DB888F